MVIKDTQFINEIEDKYPVDEWLVDDIHIWPLIRIQVATNIILKSTQGNVPQQQNQQKTRLLSKLSSVVTGHLNYCKNYFKDYSKNASPNEHVNAILLGDQVSRVLVNSRWYDRFCDPIIDKLKVAEFTSLHMEPLHQYHTPRYNPGIFIQPHLDWLRIKNLLQARTGIDYDQLHGFKELLTCLEKTWGITLNEVLLSRTVQYLKLIAGWFDKIIKRTQPSIGFVVCYYGIEGMAFNLSCRRNGIPSVDIQHGVQGDFHRAYGQWNRVPPNGYELLPSIFWVWSETEARAIEKWNQKVSHFHQPFIGGNPWLDISKEQPEVFYGGEIHEYIKSIKQAKVKILFCLSGLVDYGVTIPDWIKKVIMNSPPEWFWLFRLHPCELSERERIRALITQLNPAQVELDMATDLPLPILLQNVDIHITHWSTTTIEAAIFGIPTITVDQMGYDLFKNQIPEGLLTLAIDERSLSEAINSLLNNESQIIKGYEPRLNRAITEIMGLAL